MKYIWIRMCIISGLLLTILLDYWASWVMSWGGLCPFVWSGKIRWTPRYFFLEGVFILYDQYNAHGVPLIWALEVGPPVIEKITFMYYERWVEKEVCMKGLLSFPFSSLSLSFFLAPLSLPLSLFLFSFLSLLFLFSPLLPLFSLIPTPNLL